MGRVTSKGNEVKWNMKHPSKISHLCIVGSPIHVCIVNAPIHVCIVGAPIHVCTVGALIHVCIGKEFRSRSCYNTGAKKNSSASNPNNSCILRICLLWGVFRRNKVFTKNKTFTRYQPLLLSLYYHHHHHNNRVHPIILVTIKTRVGSPS